MVDLFQRIYREKDLGDSSNFDRVFSELRALKFAPVREFEFKNQRISWVAFNPNEHYKDIILESEEAIYLYLRNDDLSIEVAVKCLSYDLHKPFEERALSIGYLWVLGNEFPGLSQYKKRPVAILNNNPVPDTPLEQISHLLRLTFEKYQRMNKSIFEVDGSAEKGWKTIVKKECNSILNLTI